MRLIVPAGLILLVALLGALQYRWLGQVSEAERAQLQRSLSQRAIEFAGDFDREIALAHSMLGIDADALESDPWSALATRHDAWTQRAGFPTLVKALYIARGSDKTHTLTRLSLDTRTGEAVDWPEALRPVQVTLAVSAPRLTGQPASRTQVFTLSLSPLVEEVPALIVPIASRPQRDGFEGDMMVALRLVGTNFVVVELDRDVLARTMVPALVERHFPAGEAHQYTLAVLDRTNKAIYTRGVNADVMDATHADAVASFFAVAARASASTLAPPAARPALPLASAPGSVSILVQERGGESGLAATPAARMAFRGWRIMLQHESGSLDAAVSQARRRNLTTSFGILGILVAGVVLIVININARRSEQLAAQQMEFVATVSHELRTPLAVIRSAAQNLSAGVVDDPTQARRYGELIENELVANYRIV